MDPRTKRTIIVCAILALIAAVLLLLAHSAMEDAIERARRSSGTGAPSVTGTGPAATDAAPRAPRSAVRTVTPEDVGGDPDAPGAAPERR